MESLLRWSIENTSEDSGSRPPPEPRRDLDPGVIDMILGKPDAVLMKEALAVGMDATLDSDARVTALDDLEMLVEQIDNAINLTSLKMYPQILSLLSPQNPDPVRMQALWILGTAVQNNPRAQADFLAHDPLPVILAMLSPAGSQSENLPSAQTRSKAAYALSATLKHNATAVSRMDEAGGWNILRDALQDSDITIRRKIAFLINSLLIPTSPSPEFNNTSTPAPASGPTIHINPSPNLPNLTAATVQDGDQPVTPGFTSTATSPLALVALRSHGIVPVLIESLIAPLPYGPDADEEVDLDYTEKAARTLFTYLEIGGTLTSEEKSKLMDTVTSSNFDARETWHLDEKEWEVLNHKIIST